MNLLLEGAVAPTIWITKVVDRLGPTIVRRVNLALRFPKPTLSVRRTMVPRIARAVEFRLDDGAALELARSSASPALIENAIRSATQIRGSASDARTILDASLRAPGRRGAQTAEAPIPFDPARPAERSACPAPAFIAGPRPPDGRPRRSVRGPLPPGRWPFLAAGGARSAARTPVPRFVDQAPAEVYAELLDSGLYLCSIRTMYRILNEYGEVKERRLQLRHPVYTKPELIAEAPDQVWSWDITKLMGPAKWSYFYLYVIIDIFTRRVVAFQVADTESVALFKPLFLDAVQKHAVPPGQLTLHADRGPTMKAKATALLLADLGVTKSHSRPYTSNDNPFSESLFKTCKYQPQFLGSPSVSARSRTPKLSAAASSIGATLNIIISESA
jgi:transposase InsO family protein